MSSNDNGHFDEKTEVSIKINLHRLQNHTNYRNIVEVSGNTVGQCLDHLIKQFPAIKEEILDEDGEVLASIHIFVNNEGTFPKELAKPVEDGDVIDIIPLIAGG